MVCNVYSGFKSLSDLILRRRAKRSLEGWAAYSELAAILRDASLSVGSSR
jgi:hypothetical protein